MNPEVRRMFSGFAVYVGDLLVLMLRDHAKSPQDNGIWVVLAECIDPADASLRRDFPSIRSIQLLGNKIGIGFSFLVTVQISRGRHFTHAT